jgi:hypothetical protein
VGLIRASSSKKPAGRRSLLNGRRRPSPGQDARCPLGFGSHADRWPRDFSSGPAGQSLSMTATEGNHQPTLWSLVKDGWQSADAAVEGLVTALPIPDVQNAIVSLTWCQMIRAQRANLSSSGRRTRSEARTRIPTAQPTARTRLYRRAAPGGGNVPASDQQRKGTSLRQPAGLPAPASSDRVCLVVWSDYQVLLFLLCFFSFYPIDRDRAIRCHHAFMSCVAYRVRKQHGHT